MQADLHNLHLRAEDKTGKVDRRLRSEKADVDNAKEFSGPRVEITGQNEETTAVGCGCTPRREM